MKARFPFHPFAFGAFPILLFYLVNIGESRPQQLWIPLLAAAGIVLLFWGLTASWFRDAERSALAASILLSFFFCYGHLYVLVRGSFLGGVALGRNRLLLPICAVAMAVSLLALARMPKQRIAKWLTPSANLFGAIMLAAAVAQIGYVHARRVWREPLAGPLPAVPVAGSEHKGTANPDLPDIYYIIPDSYEGADALRDEIGMDNSEFLSWLGARGFYVAERSNSNYPFTALSLPSSMNMGYLGYLTDSVGRYANDRSPLTDLMQENRVMAYLKSKGYSIINAGSWWGPTSTNRTADINFRSDIVDEFTLNLIRTTLLQPFSREFSVQAMRQKVLYTFDRLAEIPSLEGPTFTLAHIICPHPPYVFGPNGEKLNAFQRLLSKSRPKDFYRDHVLFVNSKLSEAVGAILAQSPRPPVIIIQGDHGAAYTRLPFAYSHRLPDSAYLREQMSILNAYHLPGVDSTLLYPGITPVNSFRLVFNAYFGAGLPLLGDSSFYSSQDSPYDFTNVTGIVAGRAPRAQRD